MKHDIIVKISDKGSSIQVEMPDAIKDSVSLEIREYVDEEDVKRQLSGEWGEYLCLDNCKQDEDGLYYLKH